MLILTDMTRAGTIRDGRAAANSFKQMALAMFLAFRCFSVSSLSVAYLATTLLTTAGAKAADAPLETLPAVAQPQVVRFEQIPTRVGDRLGQELSVALDLTTRITQSGQTAHESTDTMRRQQRRMIEVLETTDGQLRNARVTFAVSRLQTPGQPVQSSPAPQSIEGKTYLVARNKGQLAITDEQGELPPLDEFQAAAESLQTLGKPNLLAQFLLERPVQIGQPMLVPRAVARALMGVSDQLGAIKRFELTLTEVRPAVTAADSPRAVFAAQIQTMANDESPIELSVKGRVVIETATSRVVAADLSGPVQMQAVEQTSEGIYQFDAAGSLRVAIRSDYAVRSAKR